LRSGTFALAGLLPSLHAKFGLRRRAHFAAGGFQDATARTIIDRIERLHQAAYLSRPNL
jgi:hypothetical protein